MAELKAFETFVTESSFSKGNIPSVTKNILTYLEKHLGKLYKLPDEHFQNSRGYGWGLRLIIGATKKSIRFNWSKHNDHNVESLRSIDIWNGTSRDPNFNIKLNGSIVKALPQLIDIIKSPHIGDDVLVTEARQGKFSTDQLVDMAIMFITKNKTGFSRSQFAKVPGVNYYKSAVIDTIVELNPKNFHKVGKSTVYNGKGIDANAAKARMHEQSTLVSVTKGADHESYLPTPAETEIVEKVPYTDQLDHLDALTTGIVKGAFNALFVAGRGGIGKTETIERTLSKLGLQDGKGYFKVSGAASPIGIYATLYRNRKEIILFDDSDGALADVNARNIIKAATDTKKVRKLSWNKKSSFMYNPDLEGEEDDEDQETGEERYPTHFEFTGRVIFISNLPLHKLDPDGAIRTRAFIINIDPTEEELYTFMEKILGDIRLESGSLTSAQRDKVLQVVKSSKRKQDVSIRKLVRALNIAAAGVPGWEKLVDLYA